MDVLISEVGPRDGLQSIASLMPLRAKKDWITREAAAGMREIEVGSFVNYRTMPQMADTAELVAHGLSIAGLQVAVLVPNLRGAQQALTAGAHKISIPVSASESHSLANVNRSHDQMIAEVRAIRSAIDVVPDDRRPFFEANISTAFGCTIEGAVPLAKVVSLAGHLMDAGAQEVGLSDTTGVADPRSMRQRIRAVRGAIGAGNLSGVHLHNTRGQGLANVLAALEEGITTFDASLAGLGGCPAAPGAGGNIVTEDLVFMLHAMGVKTGIDLDALCTVRDVLAKALPNEPLHGFVGETGTPPGWPYED